MKVMSLFSGIGGMDLGFDLAGHETVGQVEWDDSARTILEQHWPGVPRWGNIEEVRSDDLPIFDVLTGGFPCQDISVAGHRKGLDGDRSRLWWEFARIIADRSPRWVLIENVAGLLSSNDGADLGAILWTLEELGYGWAYRTLDAQFFGVAQRRRRVFIVGHLGGHRAGAVLFEPESCNGDPPPRRGERTVASALTAHGVGAGGGPDDNAAQAHHLVAVLRMREGKPGGGKGPLISEEQSLTLATANDQALFSLAATSTAGADGKAGRRSEDDSNLVTAFAQNTRDEVRIINEDGQIAGALAAQPGMKQQTYLAGAAQVRRLTPRECERLQGFPDDWTAALSDTQRYKTLGNAVAVPVARWIGSRL